MYSRIILIFNFIMYTESHFYSKLLLHTITSRMNQKAEHILCFTAKTVCRPLSEYIHFHLQAT